MCRSADAFTLLMESQSFDGYLVKLTLSVATKRFEN